MRAAGTYRVRSSWRPVARGMGDFISEGLANDCLTFGPAICDFFAGKGTYAAALAYKANSIPSPAQPPIVPAIDPNMPPPSSADEANATINAQLAQQLQAWKDQNAALMASVANVAATNTPDGAGVGIGLSTMAIAAIAAGGVAVLLILSGRRRR